MASASKSGPVDFVFYRAHFHRDPHAWVYSTQPINLPRTNNKKLKADVVMDEKKQVMLSDSDGVSVFNDKDDMLKGAFKRVPRDKYILRWFSPKDDVFSDRPPKACTQLCWRNDRKQNKQSHKLILPIADCIPIELFDTTLLSIKLQPVDWSANADVVADSKEPPHRFDDLLATACASYAEQLQKFGDTYSQAAFWCDIAALQLHDSMEIADVLDCIPPRYWIVISAACEAYVSDLLEQDRSELMSAIEHLSEMQVEIEDQISNLETAVPLHK